VPDGCSKSSLWREVFDPIVRLAVDLNASGEEARSALLMPITRERVSCGACACAARRGGEFVAWISRKKSSMLSLGFRRRRAGVPGLRMDGSLAEAHDPRREERALREDMGLISSDTCETASLDAIEALSSSKGSAGGGGSIIFAGFSYFGSYLDSRPSFSSSRFRAASRGACSIEPSARSLPRWNLPR